MTRKGRAVDFGKRVVAARVSMGKSQAGIARQSGIAPSYLSRIENGRIHPTVETAARIAAALRVPLDSLVHAHPEERRKGACPVSRSGACMLDLARPEVGPLPRPGEEGYTPRQLRLLRKMNELIGSGSPDLIRALEVLVSQMSR
jgi:transcriptional regulator with XRE-family HTH domain